MTSESRRNLFAEGDYPAAVKMLSYLMEEIQPQLWTNRKARALRVGAALRAWRGALTRWTCRADCAHHV
jgi:hypothetical protein